MEDLKEIIKNKKYEYKNGEILFTKFGIIVNVEGISTSYVKSIEEAKKYIDKRENFNAEDYKKYLKSKIKIR